MSGHLPPSHPHTFLPPHRPAVSLHAHEGLPWLHSDEISFSSIHRPENAATVWNSDTSSPQNAVELGCEKSGLVRDAVSGPRVARDRGQGAGGGGQGAGGGRGWRRGWRGAPTEGKARKPHEHSGQHRV